jgi:hypothetical protein
MSVSDLWDETTYELWVSSQGWPLLITFYSADQAKRYVEQKQPAYELLLLKNDNAYKCKAVEQWHPLNGWSEIN